MTKMLKVVGASWLQTKVSSYILAALGVLAIMALFIGQMDRIHGDGNYSATVFWSKKTGFRIEYWGQSNELAAVQRGVARAYYRVDINTTGWSQLEIETDGSYPDWVQAYSAGILEGALTWQHVHAHLENTVRAPCRRDEHACDLVSDALDHSATNIKRLVADHEDTDPFWHQVGLFYTQIEGIYMGWKYGVERSNKEYEMEKSDLYWLNAMSEIKEIQEHLNLTLKDSLSEQMPGGATAFLKIVNETVQSEHGRIVRKKLFVAQNAAGSYASMTRILKRYKFSYHLTADDNSPLAPGTTLEFSGYPGAVSSHDELYVVRGARLLGVTGTTLRNFNKTLWKNVNINDQVPVGPRVAAANRLATNVSSWGHMMAGTNSGTACKQWLVVDFSQLEQGTPDPAPSPRSSEEVTVTETSLSGKNRDVKHVVVHHLSARNRRKGLLWLVEQVPGYTHSGDLSDALLDRGHWATYGLPFFKDIAEVTRTFDIRRRYGNIFLATESARAKIFKKASKNATNINSIFRLMRGGNLTLIKSSDSADTFNDSLNDGKTNSKTGNTKWSGEGYWMNLGVRGDLPQEVNEAYGVIDTKAFSGTADGKVIQFTAISSPPYTPIPQVPTEDSTSQEPINKGNLAPVSLYTDEFNDRESVNGELIRSLVKSSSDHADNATSIQPFQWSLSQFDDVSHEGLPDKWEFEPFSPLWVW